jgi:transcription initiation factor TFIIIB Brf1 subunit/transcription initiation factor TFIIB
VDPTSLSSRDDVTAADTLERICNATGLARLARDEVLKAAEGLTGSRLSRAREWANTLADCVTFGERLHFVGTQSDSRAKVTRPVNRWSNLRLPRLSGPLSN